MSDFIFLDSVWKCLLTLTVSTTLVFSISLLGYRLSKRFIPNEQAKWFFNNHILFTVCALVGGPLILIQIDPELAARCFDHFATSSDSYLITRFLAGGYLVTLTIMLALDSAKLFLAAQKHRAFAKVENHQLNEMLMKLTTHLKIKTPIEVLMNPNTPSPYVWGLFKHRIVVNSFLLNAADEHQVSTILSHELMHIRGNDSAWLLLSHLSRRIFFFNPLSYLFYSKHKLVVEMAADEKAIEQCGVEPKTLLQSILQMAELCSKKQDGLLQVHASQEFTEIKERIQSMMGRRRAKIAWVYPAISIISLVLSLTITALQTNASVGVTKNGNESEEFMCSQVRHEKAIENLLWIETPLNKCEIK
ncbi:MAG: M56 family metallopeptidase [Pseudobdellovibrionaceae bacterium]